MRRRGVYLTVLQAFLTVSLPALAYAGAAPAPPSAAWRPDSGDTAWLLASAALVLLMTPGLAFFYGGLVRRKNVLSLLMQCFAAICMVTIQWIAFGYSLAFGPDVHGLIGNLDWAWLAGVGAEPNPAYAATVPHEAFMVFQLMFAIITPALIVGAFAERMKFSAFCVFAFLWATLVYDPVCHWVWGAGGWLRAKGALDFAGGTVVHVNAGLAALAAALVLGKRSGYPETVPPPHNLPFAVLGAGILWFGWFGFNAGSALGAGSLAVGAFVATHAAAAAGGATWATFDWIFNSRPTALGTITGVVAGLVAITPAAGFVSAAGALATGLFAAKAVNPSGADGLLNGNPGQLLVQAGAVLIVAAYSFVASLVLLKIVDAVVGLRVSEREERLGLDLTQHRETGYTVLE